MMGAVTREIPDNWEQELVPRDDETWLHASYESKPLHTGIAILVADSHSPTDTCVHPIAVTTDIGNPVDKRDYELIAVRDTPSKAEEFAHTMMCSIVSEFNDGKSEFISEAVQTETTGTQVHVGQETPPLHDEFVDDTLWNKPLCPNCGGTFVNENPIAFGLVTGSAPEWTLRDYWCNECHPRTQLDVDSGIIVALICERQDDSTVKVRELQALQTLN